MTKHVYIHIPFCDQLCSYCDFVKVLNYKTFVKSYLEVLFTEIKQEYRGEKLETIYFGGGTPSALAAEDLRLFLQRLSIFQRSASCEITFEANVESLTQEKLEILQEFGVNRLSIGVQTFEKKLLKDMHRSHSLNDVENVLTRARKVGFKNINLDLMFALPNQTIEMLKEDLRILATLNVEHISIYNLIIEEKSIFGFNKLKGLDQDLEANMYKKIVQELLKQGFRRYEISNFSKTGFESRHNLAYWHYHDYYGFGLGAHQYIKGFRSFNTHSITSYLKGSKKTSYDNSTYDMSEYIFLHLRTKDGIDKELFFKKFQVSLKDVYNIEKVLANGWLIETEKALFLSEAGILVANEVFEIFV